MPKKKKVAIGESAQEPEEESEKVEETPAADAQEKEVADDSFNAGASGKFDEESTPADAPVEDAKNDDDSDLVDSELAKEEELEATSPIAPANDDFDFSPPRKETGGKKLMWIIVIVLLLAAGIGGGMYIFKNGMPGAATPTPSPEPTMEATPTPMPELERSELNIQVQNGIGVPGTAKEAQEFLEELGYAVGGAKNAANYDYTQTEIMLKEDKMGYKEQLIKDLSGKYTVSDDVDTLDEDSEFDAVVIIGGSDTTETEEEE